MTINPKSSPETETWRGVALWAVKQFIATIFLVLVVYLSAGRMNWMGGQIFFGVWVINLLLSVLILVPNSPELLAERSQVKEGADRLDILLAALMAYSFIFNVIVAGLDARFGWTARFPLWVMLAGGVVALAGAMLTLWAMVDNPFFSGVVRIQRERGHTVVSSGPYRYVRHPGYVGALVFILAMPVLLGSWWAFVPAIITTCTSIYRTAREDRTLQRELEGYRAYAQEVPYRLVPGIW